MSFERLMALKYKFEYDNKIKELELRYIDMLKEKDSKISNLESINKKLIKEKINNSDDEKDKRIKELIKLKEIQNLRIRSLEDKLVEKYNNYEYVYVVSNQEHITNILNKFKKSLKDILSCNLKPFNHSFIENKYPSDEIYALKIKNHHINNHLHQIEKKNNLIKKKIQDLILAVEHFENYNITS